MKRIEELEEDIATLHVMIHGLLRRAGFTSDQSVDYVMFCGRAARKIKRDERMAAMGCRFTPDGGVAPIEEEPVDDEGDIDDESDESASQASDGSKHDAPAVRKLRLVRPPQDAEPN